MCRGRPSGLIRAGRPPEWHHMIQVEALLLRLAGGWIPVGGDGTSVDGRGRPALMRPLGVPLHVPVLPPLSLAFSLLQESTPCCPLREERRWGRLAWVGSASLGGVGRPGTRPIIFEKFFVKFYGCKLSNFKYAHAR